MQTTDNKRGQKTSSNNDDEKSETDKTEKKQHPHYKNGRNTTFTSVFGIYLQTRGYGDKGSCQSRHGSVEEANESAKKLWASWKKSYGPRMSEDCINCEDPFEAFAVMNWGSSTMWLSVKETTIEQCHLSELKQIATREGVELNSKNKSKKKLFQILKPLIAHKIHLNYYKEFDFFRCDVCRQNEPEMYKKWKEERESNPIFIENKLIQNMYKTKLSNPITEKEVRIKYGLTNKEMEKGVIAQKLHYQRKVCFGNQYCRYEKFEIIRYHKEIQKKKEEQERAKKRVLDECKEPPIKKRKLNIAETEIKQEIDYKGVPENLRKYEWLYLDCESLTDENRQKIMDFLCAKYVRNDVENEDVLLKTITNSHVVKDTVLRMCFNEKKWKKVCISRKIK